MLHAAFFLIGILTVLLGQILPILSKRMSLNDREAGYLFIAQFTGSLAGTFFFNGAVRKFGYLRMLAGAFCLTAAGCSGLNFNFLFWSAAAIFIYGIGIGAIIPAINLLVVEINRKNSSSALNTINFFWGLGAVICKPFVDYTGSPDNISLPVILLFISFLLIGAAFWFSHFPIFPIKFEETENFSGGGGVPIWKTTTAWTIAVFGFIHIGIESSVGGWLTTYESRLTESSSNGWLSAALIFFLFLVIGRGVAPLYFRFLSENTVLLCNLIVMTAGIILILLAKNLVFLIFGAAITGLGTSTVFPTNMSRFTKIFGARAIENATPLFILGSLGGAFTTWLVGYTSTAFNSLRFGFSVVLISCVSLVVLQTILARIKPENTFCKII